MMTRLQGMLYNYLAGKDPDRYCWGGGVTCLDPPLCFARYFPRTFYGKPASRCGARPVRTNPSSATSLPCCCRKSCGWAMRRRANTWASQPVRCDVGASVGRQGSFPSRTRWDEAGRRIFPPLDHAQVKALAGELVAESKQPLSRQSLADVTARVQQALGKPISRSTVWRILATDAIKPWRYQYWIFPRDPHFAEKAGPILDLYAGTWQGHPLGPKDHILSADEKTSIQARIRCHPSLPPAPSRPVRVEHEYKRGGALQYLAAWDVRRGYVIGRCEPKTGIVPFGRLVTQVLAEEPYRSGERLFWIVDNGSSHRGAAAKTRLQQVDSRIILVHTPVHASWLNQIEIYFSIVQRKVLTPNDFISLADLEKRLLSFQERYQQAAKPFRWTFKRADLLQLIAKLKAKEPSLAAAA